MEAIKLAKRQDGFAGFCPPLEDQLIVVDVDKLFFRVDVSQGHKQAFVTMWVRIK